MATKPKFSPDWSSLPDSLLNFIAELLPTHVDILRFRAVCRSFRSSVALSPEPWFPYPNLKIPGTISYPEPESEPKPVHIMLTQSVLYAIEPLTNVSRMPNKTKTWVLRVEELDYGLVCLRKPFCGHYYWELHNELPESLNLLDYRVKELDKIYKLDLHTDTCYYDYAEELFRKVVVSDDGSTIMALLDEEGAPIVWRNKVGDWTDIIPDTDYEIDSYCEDIIYHNGKFYAVYRNILLITVDPEILDITEIKLQKIPFQHSKHLVKSFDDLFLIIKYYETESNFGSNGKNNGQNCHIRFCTLKFDKEKKEFVTANDAFAEGVVFVGHNFSFSVSARDFPGLRKNCVYFEDGLLNNRNSLDEDDDLSVEDDDDLSVEDDDDLSVEDDDDLSVEDDDYLSSDDKNKDDLHTSQTVGIYDFGRIATWRLSAFPHTTINKLPTWLKSSSGSSP